MPPCWWAKKLFPCWDNAVSTTTKVQQPQQQQHQRIKWKNGLFLLLTGFLIGLKARPVMAPDNEHAHFINGLIELPYPALYSTNRGVALTST